MAKTAAEKRVEELESLKAALETPTKEDDQAVIEARIAELEKQVEADKAKADKPKPVRKKVNLDKELAKKVGTFAVGVQAAMRERIRNR